MQGWPRRGKGHTLALAIQTARSAPPEKRGLFFVDLGEALAACGNAEGAVAIANELAPRYAPLLLVRMFIKILAPRDEDADERS